MNVLIYAFVGGIFGFTVSAFVAGTFDIHTWGYFGRAGGAAAITLGSVLMGLYAHGVN